MPTLRDDTGRLAQALKITARRLGFTAVGITGIDAFETPHERLAQWVAQGRHGHMHYLEAFFNRHARFRASLPGLRSLIVVAASYAGGDPGHSLPEPTGAHGQIARYGAGRDYHRVMLKRLARLGQELQALAQHSIMVRCCVDTAPLHERSLAEAAGVGFVGKNTCLILPKGGSWIVLGVLATDLELAPDTPITQTCGACTRCLEACPTNALTAAYAMDARRCIAYLTLEHRGEIPEALRPQMDTWVAGCDICQEVCPYNAKPAPAAWPELTPSAGTGQGIPLRDVLQLESARAFEARFAGTAVMRPKYHGLVRNAAIAAGNSKDASLLPLVQARAQDADPGVRVAAVWAAARLTGLTGAT